MDDRILAVVDIMYNNAELEHWQVNRRAAPGKPKEHYMDVPVPHELEVRICNATRSRKGGRIRVWRKDGRVQHLNCSACRSSASKNTRIAFFVPVEVLPDKPVVKNESVKPKKVPPAAGAYHAVYGESPAGVYSN